LVHFRVGDGKKVGQKLFRSRTLLGRCGFIQHGSAPGLVHPIVAFETPI
jgi:hypothetical protein